MNKLARAIEIIMVAIITDYIFLLSIFTYGIGSNSIFHILLILLPFLCSILFYMIIQSPSRKEKVAFNLFRIVLLLALVKTMAIRFQGGDSQVMFLGYVLLVVFLDAVFSVLIFYLIGWWIKRKQLSVTLGIRCKRVVEVLMTSFIIITSSVLIIGYWHYFDGSWSGIYIGTYSNDKVVLDQHYFCYNDVVEADFKVRNRYVVLDIDSIRIKENSSDLYSDSQKQRMLDEIIFLAENNRISLASSNSQMYFVHDLTNFDETLLERVFDPVPVSGNSDGSYSQTFASRDSNNKVVLDKHYFCYNDVVEADFKYGDGAIVLDIDSIRIKENSSDLYTDSEKQQMLDGIISLAESNGFHRGPNGLYLYHNSTHFKILYPVAGVAFFYG
ncbi:hypothetical protein [Butyrivibrio sp. AE3009]|uniref:hypothetical protein n=1 Tax=Butyrivibrio sp. AE3009 TaxID=1280666 RepID=UPI0003B5E565|nr:hypothetical protein [Butyrivibrio sp. AE3009]